jgi:hypothetical protein
MFVCAGCVNETYWYKKDKTYLGARADCWECVFQAQKDVNGVPGQEENASVKSLKASEVERQKIISKCMTNKGYKKTWDFNLDFNIRKGFFEYKDKQYNIAGK